MRDRFVQTTAGLLDEYPNLALVLAEISVALFRDAGVTEKHASRCVNVGIREQLLIGVAAGFAKEGFRPIAHTYAPFLIERPFEQIKLDFTHQGLAGILVSVGGSRDSAAAGRTHQAPEDVALMSTLPQWEIYVPGHPDEVEAILRHVATLSTPAYVRLSEQTNEGVAAVESPFWSVVRDGAPGGATVIAVGPVLGSVLQAVDQIAGGGGCGPTVLYTARPIPVDDALLRDAVRGNEVAVVEPYLAGTSIAGIARALCDAPRRYLGLGFPKKETRHYGTLAEHVAAAGLDAEGIERSLRRFLGT